MENNYNVKIYETSREFDARERIAIKDLTNSQKFDTIIGVDDVLTITPTDWAVLEIHNEKAEKKDYLVYVIMADNGVKYYTSSAAFWNSFMGIFDEMQGDSFSLDVYKRESKNFKGKHFITCSIH